MTVVTKQNITLDTSFLISLLDQDRITSSKACECFEWIKSERMNIVISPIVLSEYCVKSSTDKLVVVGKYDICVFDYSDALISAKFRNALITYDSEGSRDAIKDDIKILAQCETKKIDYIVTDDVSTLANFCNRLCESKLLNTKVIVLKDFDPDRSKTPN